MFGMTMAWHEQQMDKNSLCDYDGFINYLLCEWI